MATLKLSMMNVSVNNIKPNPQNPRVIRDAKFEKLKKSIADFPDMLNKRPLVCFTDTDGKYVVLGGNMRLKAAQAIGLKELPIVLADDWTAEQRAEFLIKDNISFGEHDWEKLANEWDAELLDAWGLDVHQFQTDVNLDDFFNEDNSSEKDNQFKIVLEYTEDDYNLIQETLKTAVGSKEQIFFKSLGL